MNDNNNIDPHEYVMGCLMGMGYAGFGLIADPIHYNDFFAALCEKYSVSEVPKIKARRITAEIEQAGYSFVCGFIAAFAKSCGLPSHDVDNRLRYIHIPIGEEEDARAIHNMCTKVDGSAHLTTTNRCDSDTFRRCTFYTVGFHPPVNDVSCHGEEFSKLYRQSWFL